MKLKYLFFILIFLSSKIILAQDQDNQTAVGFYFSKSEYRGDHGNALWKINTNFNLGGIVAIQQYLSPSFDIGIQGGYGRYTYTNKFYGKKFEGILFTNFKLNNGYIFNKKSLISPFLTGGLGFAGYNAGIVNSKGLDFILPLGAGFKLQLTDNFALEYKYILNFTNNDTRDGAFVEQGRNDLYGQHFAGLIMSFGGVDNDNDGVKNSKDLCPNTSLGIIVDKNGCPLDTDNDGIYDYLDNCPNVVGSKLFNGCPDTDGDGIPDNKDQCADTPDNVKVNRAGCPKDIDNDGTPDYLDNCPDIKGIAKFHGCPDTDGDGISDELDKCPTDAGLQKFGGCPDSDLDNVPDNIDKCPQQAGTIENKGCPNVKEETNRIFTQAMRDIQFETGKDIIRKQSFTILDKIVKIMNENPAYNLIIEGHTDNSGNNSDNLILSEKRASAVLNYLILHGISIGRLTAVGYGESTPIADNKTNQGKILNRRVELKVVF